MRADPRCLPGAWRRKIFERQSEERGACPGRCSRQTPVALFDSRGEVRPLESDPTCPPKKIVSLDRDLRAFPGTIVGRLGEMTARRGEPAALYVETAARLSEIGSTRQDRCSARRDGSTARRTVRTSRTDDCSTFPNDRTPRAHDRTVREDRRSVSRANSRKGAPRRVRSTRRAAWSHDSAPTLRRSVDVAGNSPSFAMTSSHCARISFAPGNTSVAPIRGTAALLFALEVWMRIAQVSDTCQLAQQRFIV